jgi:hypothetical protein
LGAHLVVKEHHENLVDHFGNTKIQKELEPLKINFGMNPKNKPKLALILT